MAYGYKHEGVRSSIDRYEKIGRLISGLYLMWKAPPISNVWCLHWLGALLSFFFLRKGGGGTSALVSALVVLAGWLAFAVAALQIRNLLIAHRQF